MVSSLTLDFVAPLIPRWGYIWEREGALLQSHRGPEASEILRLLCGRSSLQGRHLCTEQKVSLTFDKRHVGAQPTFCLAHLFPRKFFFRPFALTVSWLLSIRCISRRHNFEGQ